MIVEAVCKQAVNLNKELKLKKNFKIFLNYVLGPLLFVWISYSLYRQVRAQPDLPQAWQHMRQAMGGSRAWMLWLCVALMPVNWAIESYKWYVLANRLQPLSFVKAVESVLSGLSLSLNTPNRIGEYGGRVLYLQPSHRLKGVALTVTASIAQLCITLLLGWVGLLLWKPLLTGATFGTGVVSDMLYTSFQYLLLLCTVLTFVFYFRMQWLTRLLRRAPVVKKTFSFMRVWEELSNRLLLRLLWLSFVRFGVFALQYLLLWNALGADMPLWQGFWGVALMFVIMAAIPTFAIAELGIRGKVALAVGALLSSNTLALLAGTVGMWLLNLVLPALVGSVFLLTLKLFRER